MLEVSLCFAPLAAASLGAWADNNETLLSCEIGIISFVEAKERDDEVRESKD